MVVVVVVINLMVLVMVVVVVGGDDDAGCRGGRVVGGGCGERGGDNYDVACTCCTITLHHSCVVRHTNYSALNCWSLWSGTKLSQHYSAPR